MFKFSHHLSVDSVLDEMLRNAQTCTHTHTCNPPGQDSSHTHTCFHTHTRIFPSHSDDKNNTNLEGDEGKPRRRPSGNREAVRKYREKKKAHTAFLEEEVKKLRAVNQQMIKKVQRQVVLEAEVMRLRGLLLKLRDNIDSESGGSGFPFQKHCNSATLFKEGDRGGKAMRLHCENDSQCFNPQGVGSPPRQASRLDGCGNKMVFSLQHCQPATADCLNLNQMGGGKEKSRLDSLVLSSSHAEYPKE